MAEISLLGIVLVLSVVYYFISRYLSQNCCPECMMGGFMRKM